MAASRSLAADPTASPSSRLLTFIPLAAAYLVVLSIFKDTLSSLVAVWSHSVTFAHGFLILPICIYLTWHKRAQLALVTPTPNFSILAIVAVVGVVWLLGRAADVFLVQQFALVAMLPALLWTILGSEIAWLL